MKNQTKQTFKIFWDHSLKYRWLLASMYTLLIAVSIANIYRPFVYKRFIDGLSTGNKSIYHVLLLLVFQLFVIDAIIWALWRTATIAVNYFQLRTMRDLMNDSFQNLHLQSVNFFNNNFSGALTRRVTRYYRAFEDISDLLYWDMGQTVLMLIFTIAVLMYKFFAIGLLVLIWSLLYTFFNYAFSRYKLKYDLERSEYDTKISGQVSDTIVNHVNLKLFGAIKSESRSFNDLTGKWFRVSLHSWNLGAITEAVQSGLMAILVLFSTYLALRYWREGLLSVGDVVLIAALISSIFDRLWNFGRNIRRLYESLADAEEMTAILNSTPEIQDKPGAKKLEVKTGAIEFKKVRFYYHEDRNILKDFSLDIAPGEKIALVGPSGGGKTTITKLLLRFFDIQEGKILIDGNDISEVTQESLLHNLSFVPQEPILFHRSLMENIRYANPDASDEEVYAAAKLAHCHEFISQLNNKYETLVGERGVKLSGGERQRVAIARAILKNSQILMLDEATSSLDSESEKFIQDALKNLMKNKTTIVIAHRLSTIMQMDRIIVVENGKITEEGKHKELLKAQEGTYQKLWNIQAGSFEAVK